MNFNAVLNVHNLFCWGDMQAPAMVAQLFYKALPLLSLAKVFRFFHTLFAIPGLCVLLATVTGNYFTSLL